jgi:hypothetical protein
MDRILNPLVPKFAIWHCNNHVISFAIPVGFCRDFPKKFYSLSYIRHPNYILLQLSYLQGHFIILCDCAWAIMGTDALQAFCLEVSGVERTWRHLLSPLTSKQHTCTTAVLRATLYHNINWYYTSSFPVFLFSGRCISSTVWETWIIIYF